MYHVDKLPFPHLFKELSDYWPPSMQDKAMRVHQKCIKAGKFELAARIRAKYPPRRHGRVYDVVDAIGISLFASKNLGKQWEE